MYVAHIIFKVYIKYTIYIYNIKLKQGDANTPTFMAGVISENEPKKVLAVLYSLVGW